MELHLDRPTPTQNKKNKHGLRVSGLSEAAFKMPSKNITQMPYVPNPETLNA